MTRTLMIALAMLAFSGSVPALASGGGGGGSSAPSSSGPSYDPVEEYQTGLQALKDGDYAKAEKAMKRVVKVAKKDANSRYILGLAHFGQEEYKAAAKSLAKAVKYDPDMHDARAKLAISYLKTDKADKADEALAALVTAQSDCGGACADAAAIDKAIAEVNAVKTAGAEPVDTASLAPTITQASLEQGDMLYSDAVRLINLERYDEAITELKAARTILGPHPDVLTYLGFANRKQGNAETALAYYQTALDIAPNHLNANEYLGEFYLEQGNYAAAQVQLMKLDALCPFGCAQSEELRAWMAETPA